MKKLSLIFIALLFTFSLLSQTWHTLPEAPYHLRHDDIFFIDANTGWTGFGSYIYKTTDGGISWDTMFIQINRSLYLRSIGFFNSQTGIAGTLTIGRPLYRTSNGGTNWVQIMAHPTIPTGVCGISIVDSMTAYASGAYSGNPRIIRTTNSGLSWDSVATDTSLVRSLVDCYFWSRDSGIVVGGYRTSSSLGNSYAAIILTTNGGVNWQRVYLSNRIGEWCWKISFISRSTGFVSIERLTGMSYIAKTTNGGFNWEEIPFMVYDQEGIGFLNEQTGWVGGWTGPTYETTNGGADWQQVPWGININRFRFINDTTAYAVGETVYKYTTEPIGILLISSEMPKTFYLHQNYPNPFNPSTRIRFEVPARDNHSVLIIYDALGREITTLVNEKLKPAVYEVSWDASNYPSGIYFYKIISGDFAESRKMVLIK